MDNVVNLLESGDVSFLRHSSKCFMFLCVFNMGFQILTCLSASPLPLQSQLTAMRTPCISGTLDVCACFYNAVLITHSCASLFDRTGDGRT
jgi:hypothetical protein